MNMTQWGRSQEQKGQEPDRYGSLGKGRGLKPGLCHVALRAALMDVKLCSKDRSEGQEAEVMRSKGRG